MPDEQHDRVPETVPRRSSMASTERPLTITRADGRQAETTVNVVHPRGTTAQAPSTHQCNEEMCTSCAAMVRCEWCDLDVPKATAVKASVAGPSGGARPARACPACVAAYGIVPVDRHPAGATGAPLFVSPSYVGRRDAAPFRSEDGAP